MSTLDFPLRGDAFVSSKKQQKRKKRKGCGAPLREVVRIMVRMVDEVVRGSCWGRDWIERYVILYSP
jgi:RNase P subunit RPR2